MYSPSFLAYPTFSYRFSKTLEVMCSGTFLISSFQETVSYGEPHLNRWLNSFHLRSLVRDRLDTICGLSASSLSQSGFSSRRLRMAEKPLQMIQENEWKMTLVAPLPELFTEQMYKDGKVLKVNQTVFHLWGCRWEEIPEAFSSLEIQSSVVLFRALKKKKKFNSVCCQVFSSFPVVSRTLKGSGPSCF